MQRPKKIFTKIFPSVARFGATQRCACVLISCEGAYPPPRAPPCKGKACAAIFAFFKLFFCLLPKRGQQTLYLRLLVKGS